MNINEARYIVRMLDAFKENMLFLDATTEDTALLDHMRSIYESDGRWQKGSEAARAWLIMHVSTNGVPSGEYYDSLADIDRFLAQRGMPKIQRPDK